MNKTLVPLTLNCSWLIAEPGSAAGFFLLKVSSSFLPFFILPSACSHTMKGLELTVVVS